MEIPAAFKECLLDGDLSSLYYVARAIMKVQSFFGLIPNIKVKGKLAKNVFEMIVRMRRQVGNEVLTAPPEIDSLILIDREVDLVSPMVSGCFFACICFKVLITRYIKFAQLTYEGLIDELFGIKNSFLQPTFHCIPETKPGQKPKIWLRSLDNIFSAIRDLNIQYVGGRLKEKATEIDKEIQKRNDLVTVKQIKEFTQRLPQLQEDKKNLEMRMYLLIIRKQLLTIFFCLIHNRY